MVRASPTISATVSPLARRATRNAPACTSVARPCMISSSTAEAWSAVRCVPEQTASMARLRTSLGITSQTATRGQQHSRPAARCRLSAVSSRGGQEVTKYVLTARREHRLGVELEPLRRQLPMADAHDDLAQGRAELELPRELWVDDEGVIAPRPKRALQATQDSLSVVLDRGVLAVHRLAADRAPAERLDQRLMAQADAQRGNARLGERPRHRGRDHEPLGRALQQLPDACPVVTDDLRLGAELTEVLDEVVGKRVVVVDYEDAHQFVTTILAGWPQAPQPGTRLGPC